MYPLRHVGRADGGINRAHKYVGAVSNGGIIAGAGGGVATPTGSEGCQPLLVRSLNKVMESSRVFLL